LAGKPEGKSLLARPKHKWEDNVIRDLKKPVRLMGLRTGISVWLL
jgi:hypothetical protein